MDDPVRQRQSPVGGTSGTRGFAGVLPATCDFSLTNVGNAASDFCGFSRDKRLAGPARYVDPAALTRAPPILRHRGIRFMTLQVGEPLVHPDVVRLVSEIATTDVSCAMITNGWFLPRDIDSLVAAGLARLIVSIDSADTAEHDDARAHRRRRRRPGVACRPARRGGTAVFSDAASRNRSRRSLRRCRNCGARQRTANLACSPRRALTNVILPVVG